MLLLATGVSRSLTLLLPAVKQTNKKNGFIIEYTICNFLEIVCCIWIKAINLYIAFVIKFVIVCKMPSFPVFPAFVWHFKASLPLLTPQPLCIPDTQAFSCSCTYGWFTTVTLLLGNHLWFGASDNVYVVEGGAGSFLIMARVECFHTGDTIGIPHEFPEFGKWTAIPLTESVGGSAIG